MSSISRHVSTDGMYLVPKFVHAFCYTTINLTIDNPNFKEIILKVMRYNSSKFFSSHRNLHSNYTILLLLQNVKKQGAAFNCDILQPECWYILLISEYNLLFPYSL